MILSQTKTKRNGIVALYAGWAAGIPYRRRKSAHRSQPTHCLRERALAVMMARVSTEMFANGIRQLYGISANNRPWRRQ